MTTDSQRLLLDYSTTGSEAAFRELVARYIDLVYSTAIRLVEGDAHRAQDVAQTVFLDLARQAGKLSAGTMLGGWLHRDTCFVAAKMMRGERRRRTWERQATEMNALENPNDGLAHIVPVLDEAINALKEKDRMAILLRFYERRDLRSVGRALGTSEDAAQKRVARALEQLHVTLTRRGIALSVAALGTALTGQAVTAAPAGLAATVAGSALAGAAASAGAGATTVSTTAPILTAMSTSKSVLIAAALVAVACIPVGYQVGAGRQPSREAPAAPAVGPAAPKPERAPDLDNSALLAETITGPNREQAMSGVARVWAGSDFMAALGWAGTLPDAAERDEVIRAALVGKAALDPAAALDRVGTVPPGGSAHYFATTTGARVLQAAAEADFDATAAWLVAHPGRLADRDLEGLCRAVGARLDTDLAGFLDSRVQDGSFEAILPAIASVLQRDAGGQRAAVWDWLNTQPDDSIAKSLKELVLPSAAGNDPAWAFRLAADLPRTPEGDSQAADLAGALLHGGGFLDRYDWLMGQAPDRLRGPLLEGAFRYLKADTLGDPQQWVARLEQLPEAARAQGAERLAHAWATQFPEEAARWLASLGPGEVQNRAAAAVTTTWVQLDAQGAAGWFSSLAPGAERDSSARALVFAVADKFPQEAWDWALSIGDPAERSRAAAQAVRAMALRDPATAQQWVETGPLTPEAKVELQAALQDDMNLRRKPR